MIRKRFTTTNWMLMNPTASTANIVVVAATTATTTTTTAVTTVASRPAVVRRLLSTTTTNIGASPLSTSSSLPNRVSSSTSSWSPRYNNNNNNSNSNSNSHYHHHQQRSLSSLQQNVERNYSSWIHPSIMQPVELPRKEYPKAPSSSSSQQQQQSERLIVIGSGVAGCATALIAAEMYHIPVTVLCAGSVLTDCNSNWAQGGIIYRNYNPKSNDSADLLAQDIHRAGAGLCYDPAVQKVAREGPERVRQLLLDSSIHAIFANVPFDRNHETNELSLCLEASHGAPRILHKADHSGQVITQHITAAVQRHPLITVQSQTIVTDVIVQNGICIGVETIQQRDKKKHSPILKKEYASYGTVLAAGGLAGIYEHTTNPSGFNALGSSVAIARRANVSTQDLEYVQFHPTALCIPNQPRFLLTEALRGEGAILRDATGFAFAKQYHPDGELAPRDIVARAVFAESQKQLPSTLSSDEQQQQQHNVFLDITHRDAEWLHQRFPTICEYLRKNTDYDLAYDRLPIIPAAHYTCGGVSTDLNGCTNLPGLYAAGEAARTGLHGGNRLASTSLLEGLVFGSAVADHVGTTNENRIQKKEASTIITSILKSNSFAINAPTTSKDSPDTTTIHTKELAKQLLQQLKRVMWDYVGVTRTPTGLQTALTRIADIQEQVNELYHSDNVTKCLVEVVATRDAADAGYGVALAAQANKRSIGAHCIIPDHHEHTEQEIESDDESEFLTATH